MLVVLFATSLCARTYSTTFQATENPISENGMWINGAATGLDWCNVQTSSGFAWGVGPCPTPYSDPTAILTGAWGPDQSVEATAHVVSPNPAYYQEIELHLRRNMSAHVATGYEINFGVSHAYVEIVRWNGPRGNFTYLGPSCNYPQVCARVTGFTIRNGDVAKASITGDTIRVYVNRVLIASARDSTFASGNPGMGFNFGCGSTYGSHGWSSFSATDEVPRSRNKLVVRPDGRMYTRSGSHMISYCSCHPREESFEKPRIANSGGAEAPRRLKPAPQRVHHSHGYWT